MAEAEVWCVAQYRSKRPSRQNGLPVRVPSDTRSIPQGRETSTNGAASQRLALKGRQERNDEHQSLGRQGRGEREDQHQRLTLQERKKINNSQRLELRGRDDEYQQFTTQKTEGSEGTCVSTFKDKNQRVDKGLGKKRGESTPPTVRLMRRPTQPLTTPISCTTTSDTGTHSGDNACNIDDGMKGKIGAPIVRPSSAHSYQGQKKNEQTTSRVQASDLETKCDQDISVGHCHRELHNLSGEGKVGLPLYQSRSRLEQQHRGGLIILKNKAMKPREPSPPPPPSPPPSLDLSSDNQWPTISSITVESSSLELSPSSSGQSRGWSDIVKISPTMKPVIEEAVTTYSDGRSYSEGDGHVIISGVTPKKRTRKKRKSGNSATPQSPHEKKHDTPAILDLSLYMNQSPVRPVLNRKDVKVTKEVSSVTTGNVLDSTAPVMRRGKERETPKTKKPTQLRKIIDLEKAAKRELREQGLEIPPDLDVMKGENDPSDECNHSADNKEVHVDQTTPADPQTTATNHQPTLTSHQTTPPTRQIHSRRFREYCSHMVTDEINSVVELLLQDLVRFQDRQYLRDPLRAKSKRRYVCGLREVHKHLTLGRLKCVIIPPNLDHIQSTGGIDEHVSAILSLCQEKGVSVVHAMSRRRLAVVVKKKFQIGCVGIFSYDGAEGHYKRLMSLVDEAKDLYHRLTDSNTRQNTNNEDIVSPTHNLSSSYSHIDDDSPVPDPENGTGTLPTHPHVMDTPWNIFFQKKNQQNGGVTASSDQTNHKTLKTSESPDDRTVSSDLTNQSTGSDTDSEHSDLANNDQMKEFCWNVNAIEFKPSFV